MKLMSAIFGCSGPALTAEEARFFADARPWGFILFARNIESPDQVRRLCAALREAAGHEAPILIDQEGGRIQRLGPPHWPQRLPAAAFGRLHAADAERGAEACYLNARLIAGDLHALGIDSDCLPVLDVHQPGAHDVIGDRAFSGDPRVVIDLGRRQVEGLMDGGVLPIMKHIPGHGRAGVDSHEALPIVDTPLDELSRTDFVTFRALNTVPMAMTAHVVYTAVDAQRCATLSPKVIVQVIRGEIGFDGLLMSDDLSMQALSGDLAARTRLSLIAGCDVVLHCNGRLDEMTVIAQEAKPLAGRAEERAAAVLEARRTPLPIDREAAEARLADLAGGVA